MKAFPQFVSVLALVLAGVWQEQAANEDKKPASIEGIVINRVTGEPLAHAHVHLYHDRYQSEGSYGAITTAEGRFSMRGVAAGTYFVTVDRTGFVSSSPDTEEAGIKRTLKDGEEVGDLIIRLMPAGMISGRVLKPDGEAVETARVWVFGNRDHGMAITDNKGEFRVGGLKPGWYFACAEQKREQVLPEIRTDGSAEPNLVSTCYPSTVDPRAATPVLLRSGAEIAAIEIRLKSLPIVRVSGIVTNMTEVESTSVWYSREAYANTYTASLARDGSFVLWKPPSGHNFVWAEGHTQEGVLLLSAPVEVNSEGENVGNIVLPLLPVIRDGPGRVEPQELLKTHGKKTEERLKLFFLRLHSSRYGRRSDVEINDDGTFDLKTLGRYMEPDKYYLTVAGLPDGVYVRSVEGAGNGLEPILDLRQGFPKAPVVVKLGANGGEVSGIVRDTEGKAAKARIYLLLDNEYGLDIIQQSESGDNGNYSLKGLAPGKYKLLAISSHDLDFGYVDEAMMTLYERVAERIYVTEGEKASQDLKLLGN